MLRLGLIGYSEENGHPYSFSAIMNGFDVELLETLTYKAIKEYLAPFNGQAPKSFGMRVTEVWCPKFARAKDIARFAQIRRAVRKYQDFSKNLDAVLVLCDVSKIRSEIINYFLWVILGKLLSKRDA